jgi:hypothetical protein
MATIQRAERHRQWNGHSALPSEENSTASDPDEVSGVWYDPRSLEEDYGEDDYSRTDYGSHGYRRERVQPPIPLRRPA